MSLWVYGGLVAAAMLALTVVVLVRDPVVAARLRWTPPWRVPEPDDLRGVELPTRWFGYDPDRVDAVLLTTADALEVAYAELGPDGRARVRAALAAEASATTTADPASSAAADAAPTGDDAPPTGDDAVR